MKGMIGGSSLVTVSRYDRWFLDGSCHQTQKLCQTFGTHFKLITKKLILLIIPRGTTTVCM